MIIETERLILRPFEPRDLAPCVEMNADPHTMRFFRRPLTEDETKTAIAGYETGLEQNKFGLVAAELEATGDFVGIIGLLRLGDHIRDVIAGGPQVEVGWRLRSAYWGQGLAPEGAVACLQYAWDKLNFDEIVAITYTGNLPSRRVMEKIGMTHDPESDFIHPSIPADDPIAPHVVYRIFNPNRTQN